MPIPKMTSIRPGLPSRLDDVLGIALARKPIDRPSRPASILRSLIELSYESSIMATALDVAEALATVIPAKRQPGRGALDDVIRRQLADQSIARRTAVTDGKPPATETVEVEPTSTGLFRKLDSDGLARLEEVDEAVLENARNNGRSELPHELGAVHQVLHDATTDPDRRTEVGGPPTGQVPKSELSSQVRKQRGRQARGPAIWIALAAGFASAGALATWRLTRAAGHAAERATIIAPVSDAGVVEPKGTLEIDSIPTGAIVTVAGKVLGAAPRNARVSSGVKLHVKLDLKGFQLYEDELSVDAGKTVVLRPRLIAAPAVLRVETTPPGATVQLGEQVLGPTPLEKSLPAAKGAELAIARAGYETIRLKVDLHAGERTDVARELKELQKFGVVVVTVSGAANWAYVWFKGKNLGQNYTIASGPTEFRLPVGRQQLRIVHPKAAPKDVVVNVTERGPTRITVPLPL
jgi:hypothetical protein